MRVKGVYKLLVKPHIFTRDYIKKNKTFKKKVKRYIEKAISLDIPSPFYYYLLYKQLYINKSFFLAEKALLKAISLQENPFYYYYLANILKRKNQWWQVANAYKKAIQLEKTLNIRWYMEYVHVLVELNRFDEIVNLLKPLATTNQLDSNGYFEYACALKKLNQLSFAETAFTEAIRFDKKLDSENLGVGIFYEKKALWQEASYAYRETLNYSPSNADVCFRLAYVLQRSYQWNEAEKFYMKAISIQPKSIDWYYSLGFVQERAKKYQEASMAYRYASEKRAKHTPYWYYRLGYVLNKLGKYKESCDAFLQMKKRKTAEMTLSENELLSLEKLINSDKSNSSNWYKLAQAYESYGDTTKASWAYKKLIERKNHFDGALYFNLGYLLTLNGEYKEASNSFIEQRILQTAHGLGEKPYHSDASLRNIINYTEYYERYELEKKFVLYESYHGTSISCNPYAIFKKLLNDEHFKNFTHIWIINDVSKIPMNLRSYENIIFIKKNSDGYRRYLAKAKYLINNTTFPDWYIRKKGQIYLNTWHGTPIKTLGKDVFNDFMAHKNQVRNFLQASHIISPNQYTSDILMKSYDIVDSFTAVLATTGYPRQDLMLTISQEDKRDIYDKLNLSVSEKNILYAPTWRGQMGEAHVDITQLTKDIARLQKIKNINLLFRGHYMVEKLLSSSNLHITIVPNEIDTNSLLSIVDILITDYSSISIDFMALGRPILYYVYDRVEYEKERGLYIEIEELGGEICSTISELELALEQTLLKYRINSLESESLVPSLINRKQIDAESKFCNYDRGKSTQKVIDLIFFNKTDNIQIKENSKKESILIYGGSLLLNGITTSFINLLEYIDKDKYSITIVIEANSIASSQLKMEQFAKINKDIHVIPRVGRMLMTLEERWLLGEFNKNKNLYNLEQWESYKIAHNREFKRVFGSAKFDYIINFEGYTVFWGTLMATRNNFVRANAIYQHNDLYGEWKLKYPYLEQTFNLYSLYDNIVSVSEKTKEHNRCNLVELFDLEAEKFIYCDNIQNSDDILKKSEMELEIFSDELLFKNKKVFITIGRLSPEKGHKKLIKAFSMVLKKHSNVILIILGDGLLKGEIEQLIKELELEKSVFLLGTRKNPYAYINLADCFILSSDHEGQPMTLFEAMILKKPIIATDITGNRSVLENRSGVLVKNNEEGLIEAMSDFIENKYVENGLFDYEEYNKMALEMFYRKLLKD